MKTFKFTVEVYADDYSEAIVESSKVLTDAYENFNLELFSKAGDKLETNKLKVLRVKPEPVPSPPQRVTGN